MQVELAPSCLPRFQGNVKERWQWFWSLSQKWRWKAWKVANCWTVMMSPLVLSLVFCSSLWELYRYGEMLRNYGFSLMKSSLSSGLYCSITLLINERIISIHSWHRKKRLLGKAFMRASYMGHVLYFLMLDRQYLGKNPSQSLRLYGGVMLRWAHQSIFCLFQIHVAGNTKSPQGDTFVQTQQFILLSFFGNIWWVAFGHFSAKVLLYCRIEVDSGRMRGSPHYFTLLTLV